MDTFCPLKWPFYVQLGQILAIYGHFLSILAYCSELGEVKWLELVLTLLSKLDS